MTSAALAMLLWVCPPIQDRAEHALKIVSVEPEGLFPLLHPGRGVPVRLRLRVENPQPDGREIQAPVPADYLEGLSIQGPDGKWIRKIKKEAKVASFRSLKTGEFFGSVVDIAPFLDPKDKPLDDGIYVVRWTLGGATSGAMPVVVIRDYRVRVETNRGSFTLELYPRAAPRTVLNFIALVKQDFYTKKGNTFHRILKEKIIQGGCPRGDGTGGTRPQIQGEFSPRVRHQAGTVSMARGSDPDSASCQWFICVTSQLQYDRRYAAFGRVTDAEGMKTILKIARTPTQHDQCPRCDKGPCKEADWKGCDGAHHTDKPLSDVVMKKVTLEVNE